MTSRNGKLNSITFTSRLNPDIFSVLEKEALSKNISMNSLVNNVLGRYVSLDRHSQDIEIIPLTKRAIKTIFSKMSDRDIKQLANNVGGIVHKELVFLKFDELTFENLMHVLVVNASRYGSVKYNSENSKHNVCIHHGVCTEFSKFLAQIHEISVQQLSIKISITNIDQNTVCMEIIEPG